MRRALSSSSRSNAWRVVANAADQIGDLITEIPGWDGYAYAEDTTKELLQSAALLQQVIVLLRRVNEREVFHG